MHKKSIVYLFLIVLGFASNLPSYGQNISDSLLQQINTNNANKDGLTTAVDTSFNALMKRIDFYTTSFTEISKELNNGFDTLEISENLPLIEKRLQDADGYKLLTYRSLNTLSDYFATAQKQLNKWEEKLDLYNSSLVQMRELITGLTTDSTFQKFPTDSLLRNRFFARLNDLGGKWNKIDSISSDAALKISFLQGRVSTLQAKIDDFNDEVVISLKRLNDKTFTKEYDYLWYIKINSFWSDLKDGIFATIRINYKILANYLKYSYKVHLINLLLFVILAIWLKKNRNTLLRCFAGFLCGRFYLVSQIRQLWKS